MIKANELREMSDEQLQLTLKEACDRLFRLRIQAQTERLDAPSELRHHRQLIARIKTIQRQRRGPSGANGSTATASANP
jgi:large subunit ribosomal protein L29